MSRRRSAATAASSSCATGVRDAAFRVGRERERVREHERVLGHGGGLRPARAGGSVRAGSATRIAAAAAAAATAGASSRQVEPSAATPVVPVRGRFERRLEIGEGAHGRPFASPRSVSNPRLTRLRTTASEVFTESAMSL